MKVVIVGGVAAGASCAARLRRLDENAQIIMLERSGYVSYANCGLPYYVGGAIAEQEALTLQTPESFRRRFGVDVRVREEAVAIHRERKALTGRRLSDGSEYEETYDRLVLAPGAKALRPPLPGIEDERVFSLRTVEDALRLREAAVRIRTAVVVGGGFIGLEAAENLAESGVQVTLVERLPQVMPTLDADMAVLAASELKRNGVTLRLGVGIAGFETGDSFAALLDQGERLPCDLCVLALGVAPDTALAREAGLELAEKGALVVNERLQTSDPDIYAAGDAVRIRNRATGAPGLISLAGPANRQGRMVADSICGRPVAYPGANPASILKLFHLTCASTGLNERMAQQLGLSYEAVILPAAASHATYYPGAENMVLKVLFASDSGRLLGAQAVGGAGVDKRMDVLATALAGGLTSEDLSWMDLCYAPPYSSAKDPVNVAGQVMENIRQGLVRQWQMQDLPRVREDPSAVLLDVRTPAEFQRGHFTGALNLPLDDLRARVNELDRNKTYYVNCQSALRSYLACRILTQHGLDCHNLAGGWRWYALTHPAWEADPRAATGPCGQPR